MAINFPANPSNGDTYTATNGAVYIYNSAIDNWTGVDVWLREDGVDVYSSNTQAKVGIGTIDPQQKLDVVGGANFTEDVGIGALLPSGGEGVRINAAGDISVRNDGTSDEVLSVFKGGTATSNRTIQLTSDGTANFDSSGTFGGDVTIQDNGGLVIRSTDDNLTSAVTLNSDGEAAFAGSASFYDPDITDGSASGVKIDNGLITIKRATDSIDTGFSFVDGTTEVATISGDGSAVFTGTIKAEDFELSDGTLVEGTVQQVNGGTGIGTSPAEGIVETGSVFLKDTAVTPGRYLNATVTVDQQGRITDASGGTEIVVFGGPVNVTETCPADIQNEGEFVINVVEGVADDTWIGIAGLTVAVNQFVFFTKNDEWALGAVGEVDQFVTLGTDQSISGNKTFTHQILFIPPEESLGVQSATIILDASLGQGFFKGNVGIGDFTNVVGGIEYDLQIESNGGKGLLVNSNDTQNTDTNKALHVTNGLSGDTFNVSYRGSGYFERDLSIGTQTPVEMLTVVGNNSGITIGSEGSEANYYHIFRNKTNGLLAFDGVQQDVSGFDFRVTPDGETAVSSVMTIDNSRSVGIGTDTPPARLSVVEQAMEVDTLFRDDPVHTYRNGTGSFFHAGKHPINDTYIISSGSTATTTEIITVTADGDVGIGTDSPSELLEVVDDINNAFIKVKATKAGKNAGIIINQHEGDANSSLNFGDKDSNNVGQITYNHASNYLNFAVNGGTKARLLSNGNLGIGVTNPSEKLEVDGTIVADNFVKSDGTPIDGGGGDVTSVAGVEPDEDGNVPLTTGDIDAINVSAISTSVNSQSTTDVAASVAVKNAYDRVASYAPKKDGTNATGTWNISVQGSAGSADTADVATSANAVNIEGLAALP